MYDPVFNETITPETTNQSKWWDMGAEPIWQTARFQGKTSGSYFYFGGEVEIMGLHPNVYIGNNDPTVPCNERIDTVISWFLEEDIDVITLYFNQPDNVGHYNGIDSDEKRDMVRQCDDALGYLMEMMDENGLTDVMNIIVVSDHGMSEIFDDMKIELYDYIDPNDVYHVIADYGPVAMIQPKEGRLDAVFDNLRDAHPNMSVYMKEDIPDRFNYRDHYRILPIFAISDRPWEIATKWVPNGQVGGHGFDNQDMTMKNIFVATGPDFKTGYISEPFNSVDIYPLLCQILQLEPAPNNGSLEIVKTLLNSNVGGAVSSRGDFFTVVVSGLVCLYVVALLSQSDS
ncbi:ectonucleotide pyrophosphatase/phosphodiesterase family member 7-like [Ptychodera flava]|uniref:ectonucleotide pyrophosphatase/phosphodiesterase family member 7-like n=1 Tax=Ptychodera flava TaxID=63121 RepID=UPI00396A7B43